MVNDFWRSRLRLYFFQGWLLGTYHSSSHAFTFVGVRPLEKTVHSTHS